MFTVVAFMLRFLPAFAAASTPKPGDACNLPSHLFFVIPPWWEYLKGQINNLGDCEPLFHVKTDLWLIGLAGLDMLLRLAGLIAVISIIVAGFQYVTSAGNAETITNARRRIIYALSGLAIALVATAVVSFVGRTFGG